MSSTPSATILELGPSVTAFADYHADFAALLNSCQTHLTTAANAANAPTLLDAADRDLQEASDLVKSLELEAQASSPHTRSKLSTHVTQARADLHALRTQLRGLRVKTVEDGVAGGRGEEMDREMLFQGVEAGQRKGVMDVTGRLEQGGEMIQSSRRLMAEAEMVGVGILEDLQHQRQTILRARESVAGAGEGLQQSQGLLGTMHRRAIVNRVIVWVVLGGIVLACVGVLYARLFHAGGKE
eukprot:GFKZ01000044.1.p1 GENE.GFKZ01000044.1~~GFKZ01000044.1.p1  ORF type:complete len:274 (-),score=30.46 GFKZ01000044.1:249-971(-)